MKLLLMTGPLYPQPGNNANLTGKLIPHFLSAGHEVHLFSAAFSADENKLPKEYFGVPVHWATDQKLGLRRRLLYPAVSRLKEDPGYNGELGARLIEDAVRELKKTIPYDAILCTMQPYPALLAASGIPCGRRVAYLMDPPDFVIDDLPWEEGQKQLRKALGRMDRILTTRFIRDASLKKGAADLAGKMVSVSFPHLEENRIEPAEGDVEMPSDRINLLFCGALFPSVRDPGCFLRVLERLDERFCVTFMGRNCEQFWSECAVPTKAEVRVFPPQPYQVAVNAMEHADVLINVGNNMRVHMPSKTLDYINTGKPIVNFHKYTDCPTLFYTERYPLCLNLYEKEFCPERDVTCFIDFCLQNKDKRVPRTIIENGFSDCKPETIAGVVLEQLETLQS